MWMVKRIFDFFCAFFGIIFLSPVFILASIAVLLDSRGGVFYIQKRVGKGNKDFNLLKFRTMFPKSDKQLQLTVGNSDQRITRAGRFLRKYKIDELPQLINVLKGDMSMVGPRPEVRKYVDLYTPEQQRVLTVKPGITDRASIEFRNENELLAAATNPESYYIREILPRKLQLNLEYIERQSLALDLKLIFQTVYSVFLNR